MSEIPDWIESIGLGINLFGVIIITIGIVVVSLRSLYRYFEKKTDDVYRSYKQELGRVLLLGLEILVAADIIETVATEPSLSSITVLGILVIIRTFLSWSLEVEIDGKWPWQAGDDEEE